MSLKGWAKTVLFKKLFSFLKMSNSLKAWPAAAANTLALWLKSSKKLISLKIKKVNSEF